MFNVLVFFRFLIVDLLCGGFLLLIELMFMLVFKFSLIWLVFLCMVRFLFWRFFWFKFFECIYGRVSCWNWSCCVILIFNVFCRDLWVGCYGFVLSFWLRGV